MQETKKSKKKGQKAENKLNEYIQNLKNSAGKIQSKVTENTEIIKKNIITLARKNIKSPELLREYSLLAVCVVFGFLMGIAKLPQEIRPFGIAAVCALSNKKKALCVYMGVAASCIGYGNDALSSFIIYFMLYAARKVFTDSKFSESLPIRIAESAAVSLGVGIIRISTGAESFVYSLIALLSLVGVSCAFTFFFGTLFNKSRYEDIKLSTISICNYALMAAIVCSLSGLHFWGFDIQLAISCLITVFFAAVNGFLHAGTVGFVCALMCNTPSVSACIGISGILCALIMSKSIPTAIFSFVASLFVCTAYTSGFNVALSILPSVILGCIAFFPVCGPLSEIIKITSKPSSSHSDKLYSTYRPDTHKTLSEAFFSLSDVFSKLADKQRYPTFTDASIIIDKSFAEICSGCALNEMCYARKCTDMKKLKETLFSCLSSREAISEDFGIQMNEKCIRLDKLCEEINRMFKQTAVTLAKDNRTSLLAAQYAGMARLISETEKNVTELSARDIAFEKSIGIALEEANIPFSNVTVYCGRQKKTKISGISPEKIPFGAKELKKYIFAKTGLKISEPSFDIADKGDMNMSFERAPCIKVEYSQSCVSKPGRSVNGDTVNFLHNHNNYFYSYICDGMGSGREAAASSRLSSLFLEKMLDSGTKKNIILELLNNILLSRNGESFSTVDLFEADLLTGKCSFVKAGAAPTYILRGNKLYKIFSATPPVGIITGFTAESTNFDVESGDVIIMMSDGVVQNNDDSAWLAELIRVDPAKDPALLAKTILDKSKEINVRADDMSIVVIKVSDAD